jgi:DNA-binding IclR family transcriptional regulator
MNAVDLISKAKVPMHQAEAQIGQTVGLGCLDAGTGNGVVLDAVLGTAGFSYHLEPDYRFPLHTSAPGKVLLAYLSRAEREEYFLKMDFWKYTPSTITNQNDFNAELDAVVEKGYAVDVSEQLEGCHCIGVPIFDSQRNVAAALWTTGPSAQLPVRRFDQIADVLRKGAQDISSRITSSSRSSNRDYILNVVEQAQEVIQNNLHRPLDVEEMASNLYVGYSWFRKVFKEQTGMAPAAFHQHLRLEKAKELLLDSDLSVREISESLGFRNQNHFSALFKRKTGMSPTDWRIRM